VVKGEKFWWIILYLLLMYGVYRDKSSIGDIGMKFIRVCADGGEAEAVQGEHESNAA
jgi:hypothetical protein